MKKDCIDSIHSQPHSLSHHISIGHSDVAGLSQKRKFGQNSINIIMVGNSVQQLHIVSQPVHLILEVSLCPSWDRLQSSTPNMSIAKGWIVFLLLIALTEVKENL